MPVYEYRCRNCGYEFDKFLRTFETGDVNCPSCQSANVEKLFSPPVIRMGKRVTPKIGILPTAVYHREPSSMVTVWKRNFRYGRSLRELPANGRYSQLLERRDRGFRRGSPRLENLGLAL